jgi:hypothetical protein
VVSARESTGSVDACRVKGIALLGIASSVRELLGDEVHRRTLAYLPDPVREALHYGTIVSSSWVPLAWHLALHEAVLSVTLSGPTLFRRIAKHTTLGQFHSVYRVFARVAGPQATIQKAGVILSRYYSHAKVDVLETRAGFCSVRFHGCTGFTPAIWENICGACEGALEASGAGSVRVWMQGDRRTETEMIVNAHWV